MRVAFWISSMLLVGLGLACQPAPAPGPPDPAQELASALGGLRLLEPQISGGYAHYPCVPVACPSGLLCEPQCAPVPQRQQHISTASLSLLAQAHAGTAAERHTRALATLILNREETDVVVEILESLCDEQPHNQRLLSDLGAAYLVRAQRQNRASDVPLALDVLTRAIDLDPDLDEARFNRALALEMLLPGETAVSSWKEFGEEADTTKTGWIDEARQRADRLKTTMPHPWPDRREAIKNALRVGQIERLKDLVSPYRTRVRSWVEGELLPAWGDAMLRGNSVQAEELQSQLRHVAATLQELTGDQLLEESLAAIQMADETGLQSLATGHRLFGEALAQDSAGHAAVALDLYRASADALQQGQSPFRFWAARGRIISLFQRQDLEAAESLTHELLAQLPDHRWPALTASLARLSALFLARQGRLLEALREYGTAIRLYDEIGELELSLSTQSRLSDVLRTLGSEQEAWQSRLLTLHGLRHLFAPEEQYFVLHEASQAALNAGLLVTAQTLMDEALAAIQDQHQPLNLAIALRYRAEIRLSTGDRGGAGHDLERARRMAEAVDDESVRQVLLGRIQQVEGMTLARQDPQAAIIAFRAALEDLPTGEALDLRAEIRYQWARSLIKMNLLGAAEEQLEIARQHLEALWQSFLTAHQPGATKEEITFSFFDNQARIRDLLTELLVRRGAYEEALAVVEWSKAREPLERLARIDPKLQLRPLNREEILTAVPDGTTVLQYLVLEDHIKIWQVRRSKLVFHEVVVSRRQLKAWTRAIQVYSQDPDQEDSIRQVLLQYREALLPPELDDLRAGEYVVFIPHQEIHGVPFGALLDGNGQFLIEEHPILTAPSLTLFAHTPRRQTTASSATIPALLVGDPAFDPELFPQLQRLPGARQEIERLAELYPGAFTLLGPQATSPEFLRQLPRAEVVHFAGHALLNANNPTNSLLAVAPSVDHQGALYAVQIAPLQLPRTRLVVLSTCTTTGGYPIGSLGVSGLVRPFLGAGVPAVVASLWDVRDVVGPPFFTEFHKQLQMGHDTAIALQRTQKSFLRQKNKGLRSISSWAAYSLTGNTQGLQKTSAQTRGEST